MQKNTKVKNIKNKVQLINDTTILKQSNNSVITAKSQISGITLIAVVVSIIVLIILARCKY